MNKVPNFYCWRFISTIFTSGKGILDPKARSSAKIKENNDEKIRIFFIKRSMILLPTNTYIILHRIQLVP